MSCCLGFCWFVVLLVEEEVDAVMVARVVALPDVAARVVVVVLLDEDEVGSGLAGAVPELVDALPLAVAVGVDGGAPLGEGGVDAVALAPVAQVLPLRVLGTQRAHLLA
jgi:hypothetical protein